MKMKYLMLLMGELVTLMTWASDPLKKPLSFVPADSMVVWGDDRSDFRTTALAVARGLEVRSVKVKAVDKKIFTKLSKRWDKEILPSMNLLGGVADENNQLQVLPTASLVADAATLFLQSGAAQYMDVIERTSLNALMSIATPGELSFEKHQAAQALMNVSGMVYATDEQGIYVNLYVNNSTHVRSSGWDFVIDQLTAMPHAGRVKLRISGLVKGQQPIVMRLRMPNWALQSSFGFPRFMMDGTPATLPVVYVNGREEFYHMEKGFLVINRKWNSGDEVYFDFPFHVQYLQPRRQGRTPVIALQRGPLVYGFSEPTDGCVYSKEEQVVESPTPNRYGHSIMGVPVKTLQDKTLLLQAEPVMDGVQFLWLNVHE